MVSSRRSHTSTLVGHLNGVDVVLETDHHVKILLNKLTPALPQLFKPASVRITQTMNGEFPQTTNIWTAVKPLEKVVLCISRGVAVATVGEPACDNLELVRTFREHTKNGKHSPKTKVKVFAYDFNSFCCSIRHATHPSVPAIHAGLATSG